MQLIDWHIIKKANVLSVFFPFSVTHRSLWLTFTASYYHRFQKLSPETFKKLGADAFMCERAQETNGYI